jgi:branched-chain amino acid transport system permease protein
VRFIFKTSYYQDLSLFQDREERNWYVVLALGLLVTPLVLPAYLSDLSLMLIFALCGVSLMVLVATPAS